MHVVHEASGRIRLRLDHRFDSRLQPEFIAALPNAVRGVRAARANPAARSLIVRYEGGAATRAALLRHIAAAPMVIAPFQQESTARTRYLRGTLVCAVAMLAGHLLPPPLRLATTSLLVAPVILKGVRALFSRGLSVAALDAAALSIALLRREFGTAAATLMLLNLGNYLEATMSEASTDLLQRMLSLPPGRA